MKKNFIIMNIQDQHCPFHDEEAMKIIKTAINTYKPEILVFNGDLIDFCSISYFNTNPSRKMMMQEEIDVAVDYMDYVLQDTPFIERKIFNTGNHEDRLQKYLYSSAPELSTLRALSLRKLLRLDDLGFEIYGRQQHCIINNVSIFHGKKYSKWSGYSAMAYLREKQISHISGHHHRLATTFLTTETQTIFGIEGGHLSDIKKLEYSEQGINWQKGYSIVEFIDGVPYPHTFVIY